LTLRPPGPEPGLGDFLNFREKEREEIFLFSPQVAQFWCRKNSGPRKSCAFESELISSLSAQPVGPRRFEESAALYHQIHEIGNAHTLTSVFPTVFNKFFLTTWILAVTYDDTCASIAATLDQICGCHRCSRRCGEKGVASSGLIGKESSCACAPRSALVYFALTPYFANL